jgi:molybdopterin/thiamine biosynthesis adenylyltransferase
MPTTVPLPGLEEAVRAAAEPCAVEPFRCVGGEVLEALARSGVRTLREVEIAALRAGVVPKKYLRSFAEFTAEDQVRLLAARVALVGLGGLGGLVLEGLARMGLGRIRVADGDTFEESNLNRQVLATAANLGRGKAETALARAAEANRAVELEAWPQSLDETSVEGFFSDAAVVVDALGGPGFRQDLRRAAARAGLPLVTAAVAGSTGLVAVVRPGGLGPADLLAPGAAAPAENVLGTPAPAVFAAAAIQIHCVLDLARGRTPALLGRMLAFDLADARFEILNLEQEPAAEQRC